MSKVKTPQEKKRLSYKKDHVVNAGEADKAFRKNWPRKKARINRAFRRKAAQVFVTPSVIEPFDADASVKAIRRPAICKWGVMPLGEAVANRQERRTRTYGARKARQGKPINALGVSVGPDEAR